MSYPEMYMWGNCLKRKSNAEDTALNLAAAAASYGGYAVLYPIALRRLLFFVTTAVTAGTTAPQVNFQSRPTYGSSAGSVTLGTLTITNGASVGQVFYKDIKDNVTISAGSELELHAITQAADSGTAAGAGWFGFLWEPAPDADANQTLLVKSS